MNSDSHTIETETDAERLRLRAAGRYFRLWSIDRQPGVIRIRMSSGVKPGCPSRTFEFTERATG